MLSFPTSLKVGYQASWVLDDSEKSLETDAYITLVD